MRQLNTTQDNSDEEQAVEERVVSQLFYCDRCRVTFISQEMASCPQCDGEVEPVPNERELDRFHVH